MRNLMGKTFLPVLLLILLAGRPAGAQGQQLVQNVPCDSYRFMGYVIIPVRDHPENFEVRIVSRFGEQPLAYANVDLSGRYQFDALKIGDFDFLVRLDGFKELRETVRIPPMIATYKRTAAGLELTNPDFNCVYQQNYFLKPLDDTVVIDERLRAYPSEAIAEWVTAMSDDKDKNYKGVVKHLEKVVSLAADWYEAHCELGAAYEEVHSNDDAEKQYRAAIDLKPDGVRALLNLGRLLILEVDGKIEVAASKDSLQPLLDQARQALAGAVKRDEKSAMALYLIGVVDFRKASYKDAEKELTLALELDPTLFPARLTLINVYEEQKQWEDALDNLDEFIVNYPASPYRVQAVTSRAAVMRRLLNAR